jgi:hypothetical protein
VSEQHVADLGVDERRRHMKSRMTELVGVCRSVRKQGLLPAEGLVSFTVCQECGKQPGGGEKLLYCGRCGTAKYCSKTCQTANWPSHKIQCVAQQQARAAKAARGAGNEGLGPAGVARHVIQLVMIPTLLSYIASYEVARMTWRAIRAREALQRGVFRMSWRGTSQCPICQGASSAPRGAVATRAR